MVGVVVLCGCSGWVNNSSVCYLLVSSLQLHLLVLPEWTHRLHLLQVAVEGQSAQTEAVAAVPDRLQSLHLLNDGGHGNWRWYRWWWEFSIVLARNWIIAQSFLVWPEIKNKLTWNFILQNAPRHLANVHQHSKPVNWYLNKYFKGWSGELKASLCTLGLWETVIFLILFYWLNFILIDLWMREMSSYNLLSGYKELIINQTDKKWFSCSLICNMM